MPNLFYRVCRRCWNTNDTIPSLKSNIRIGTIRPGVVGGCVFLRYIGESCSDVRLGTAIVVFLGGVRRCIFFFFRMHLSVRRMACEGLGGEAAT